jgi:type I restriction enzyme S subunit
MRSADTRLGACCEIQTGPFGSQLHASDYQESGTPIITVEHLGENRIAHHDVPLVAEADRTRLSRYSLREGDIVFSRVGAIDRRAYVSAAESGWLFSGRLLRVRPDPSQVDARFLAQVLGHPKAIQWIYNHAVGSTMACLNTAILSSVPVALPPMSAQRWIAEILSTLDEAIEQTEALIAKTQQIKAG